MDKDTDDPAHRIRNGYLGAAEHRDVSPSEFPGGSRRKFARQIVGDREDGARHRVHDYRIPPKYFPEQIARRGTNGIRVGARRPRGTPDAADASSRLRLLVQAGLPAAISVPDVGTSRIESGIV